MGINDRADLTKRLLVIECRHLVDLPAVTRRLIGLEVDHRSRISDGENSCVPVTRVTGVVNPCECERRSQQHHEECECFHSPAPAAAPNPRPIAWANAAAASD